MLTWASLLRQRWHSGNPTFHRRLRTWLQSGTHLPNTSRQQKARLRKWLTGEFSLTKDGHVQFTTAEPPPWLAEDGKALLPEGKPRSYVVPSSVKEAEELVLAAYESSGVGSYSGVEKLWRVLSQAYLGITR